MRTAKFPVKPTAEMRNSLYSVATIGDIMRMYGYSEKSKAVVISTVKRCCVYRQEGEGGVILVSTASVLAVFGKPIIPIEGLKKSERAS